MTDETVETLSERPWPSPPADATALHQRGWEARRVPVARLEPEHLRILLSQRIDLDVVLPLAVRALAADPLQGGDYFEGDVLAAALALDEATWRQYPGAREELLATVRRIDRDAWDFPDDEELVAALDSFLTRWG